MQNMTTNSLAKIIFKTRAILRWMNEAEYFKALYKFMTTKSVDDTGFSQKVEKDLRATIAGPIKFGFAVIGIAIGLFIIWGGSAPLDSASIAEGTIIVSGRHKTIQHLEGGVIEKIYVTDGQEVPEGFVLLKVNDSNAKAQLRMVTSQLNFALAVQARLNAEQNKYESIIWDKEAFDFSDPDIKEILKTQENLFKYKQQELSGNIAIITERLAQNHEELIGLNARKLSYESQANIIKEELKSTEDLLAKGLALRPKLLELRRHTDEFTAGLAETKSKIAAVRESIAENKLRMINIENEYQKELAKDMKDNHSQVLDLTERYHATKDIMERTEIKAPTAGIVTDLQYHTVGGVISSGHKILDIVPQNEKLIIEAKIKTQDIDSIHPGLVAKIQLGAYKSRLVPRLDGKVVYISADKFTEQQTGHSYYIAKIEMNDSQIHMLTANIKLHPGMPVTVFIVKGTRTFLEYLISPIRDSFFKAFKEV